MPRLPRTPTRGCWIELVDCDPDFVAETDDRPLPRGTTSIRGMVRRGFLDDAADSFRDRLAAEVKAMPDATIVKVGAEPHLWFGLLVLIGGAGGLTGAAFLVRRARRRA